MSTSSDQGLFCWAWAGWEPDRHYRRLGRSSTPYFGRGQWLNAWRDRACDPKTLVQLRDAGITHLVTYCYKGFGLEIDRQEWPGLKAFVQSAHELGLKVWGYVQGGSIYPETLLLEQPTANDWAARQFDGQPQKWAGLYFRYIPCLNSAEYLAYMENVLATAISELGLDGVHMDNNYYRHCWCDRCAAGFRDWLAAIPDLDERIGIPQPTHIQPPPLPDDQEQFTDPLQHLWLEYGVQTRLAAMSRFRDAIKRANPEVSFTGNPAFPRKPAFKARLALDPSREGAIFDAVFSENGNLPRVIDDSYVTQTEAYLFAEAGGYRVLNTAWQPGVFGHTPPTTAPQLWTQMAEEFSHAPVMPGNNWALRAAGDGDRLLMDQTELFDSFKQAWHFFRQLHEQADLAGRSAWAELAVLVHPDTMTLAGSTDMPAFRALQQELLRRSVPFRVVFTGQPLPAETRAILVWQQSCLSDEVLEQLRTFAAKPGCSVLVAGESGRFDEAFIPRNFSNWQSWLASEGFVSHRHAGENFAATVTSKKHFGTDMTVATPACRAALDHLLASPHWSPALTIAGDNHVLVRTERARDGRVLVHLRDQASTGQPVEGCSVVLHKRGLGKELTFHRPAHGREVEPMTLSAGVDSQGRPTVSLPPFEHYALLTVSSSEAE